MWRRSNYSTWTAVASLNASSLNRPKAFQSCLVRPDESLLFLAIRSQRSVIHFCT